MPKPGKKLQCPFCEGESVSCVDSRPTNRPDCMVWRRRVCRDCGAKYTTAEIMFDDRAEAETQERAATFVKEVEALARRIFGDENGRFDLAQRLRYHRTLAAEARR